MAAGVTSAGSLGAQVSEVARRPIADVTHITFGSLCEDRFIIRNDGGTPVALEYAVTKGTEHTPLTLGAHEIVELESRSKEALELWMNGRLVAKAEKEDRKCSDLLGDPSVAVAPLEVRTKNDRDERRANPNMRVGLGVGWGSPFYDPFYGPFGGYGWGYRPYYAGFYGVPIIIGGGRGGRRR
ncbi:MAG: hypothetical protein IT355_06250 [Gemmatimonadaceae bacterium]|nr:hypothetical protein [Gemmatimonadaceae bacterium]